MESFDHSPVLFAKKTDGRALQFYTNYTGEDKVLIQAMIEHGGGLFLAERKHRAFLLVEAGDENCAQVDKKQVAVSMKFIWDCVEQNQLLDIKDYIMRSVIPFSREEDLTIIKYALMYADNKYGTLNEFFECLSNKKVLSRDPYSIKSRTKVIYWQFNVYGLTEDEERKFKLLIKPSGMHNNFCEEDDYAILDYAENKINMIHKKEMYDEMARKKVLNYKSKVLHSRVLTHILPNIDLYEISSELKLKIKAHLSDVYELASESTPDDYTIIHYMLGNICSMRNITTYKILKEKEALHQTAQYMQLKFLYHILPNIDSYDIFPYFKKRFKSAFVDGFALCYSFSINKKIYAWFTEDEDHILIHSIQHVRKNIKNLALYKELEKKQILRRSATSMRGRFLNRILPDICTYDIPNDLKTAFKAMRKHQKLQKKRRTDSDCESDLSNSSSIESVDSNESWYLPDDSESIIAEKSKSVCDDDGKCQKRLLRTSSKKMFNESSEADIVPPTYKRTVDKTPKKSSDVLNINRTCKSPFYNPYTESKRVFKSTEVSGTHLNSPKNKRAHSEIAKNSKQKPVSSSCLDRDFQTDNSLSLFSKNLSSSNKATHPPKTNAIQSGDLRQYFSSKSLGSQRHLDNKNANCSIGISSSQSSDIFQASASGFSQNSTIDDLVNDPLAPPTFLSVMMKRVPKLLDHHKAGSHSSQLEALEHFPLDEKVQFVTDTVNLVQDIEVTELFQEHVVDSDFYSDFAAKLYKINKNVYESYLEKEVEKILEKNKLNLQDKTTLVKYLACLNQLSQEDAKQLVNQFGFKYFF